MMRKWHWLAACLLTSCSWTEPEHPPKSVIKELLLERYSNEANRDYLKNGDVQELTCVPFHIEGNVPRQTVKCSYLFNYTAHTDVFMRNDAGFWEIFEMPATNESP